MLSTLLFITAASDLWIITQDANLISQILAKCNSNMQNSLLYVTLSWYLFIQNVWRDMVYCPKAGNNLHLLFFLLLSIHIFVATENVHAILSLKIIKHVFLCLSWITVVLVVKIRKDKKWQFNERSCRNLYYQIKHF